jgi:hypothetical protein
MPTHRKRRKRPAPAKHEQTALTKAYRDYDAAHMPTHRKGRKRLAPAKHEETTLTKAYHDYDAARTKACLDAEAIARSAWEADYAEAIVAARTGDAKRLLDLLRARRPPDEHLVKYIEELHRGRGQEGDPSLREKARQAEILLGCFLPRLGRKTMPNKLRERVYEYVCGINPLNPDEFNEQKMKQVERVREYIRKGRHRKPAP